MFISELVSLNIMLRKLRIIISLSFFALLVLYFVDFSGFLPHSFRYLAKIQLVPALLALNFVILGGLTLLTLVFGRVYCSSVCPMGFYQDIINRLSGVFQKKKKFKYTRPLTILRWSLVAITILAFLTGFHALVGLLDPYSAFGRMTVHVFKPAYLAGNNLLANIFTHFGNQTFYKVGVYIGTVSTFVIALVTLLAIGWMAAVNGRIYCNSICPVGTILGFLSRFSILKIRIDEQLCNSCGTCGKKCKASCIDTKTHTIDYSRCINCFDCLEVCSKNAISFKYSLKKPIVNSTSELENRIDASKRRFLLAAGAVSLAASGSFADSKLLKGNRISTRRKTPISPPGSLSASHLLDKCTSCHLCVSKCPSNVIQPAFTEYGFAGIMQPVLGFERGFCNYDCTICSDVCPSGALLPLTVAQKHQNQMGQVRFIIENCIVYTDGTSCGACSEHCPTQAVSMIAYKGDLTIPQTDVNICVGCGGCEYICPATPNKAIYVEGTEKHNKVEIKIEKKEEVKVDDFGF